MYSTKPSYVFGFHGLDKVISLEILNQKKKLPQIQKVKYKKLKGSGKSLDLEEQNFTNRHEKLQNLFDIFPSIDATHAESDPVFLLL